MADKEKLEVLVIEPNLDDRKEIAQLFQINNYNLSFVQNFKEAKQYLMGLIPHIVLVNLNIKSKNLAENLTKLLNTLPDETLKFGLDGDKRSKLAKASKQIGFQEVFEKPLKGMVVFERLKFYLKDLKPLSIDLSERKGVLLTMDAQLVGMSETDFILESGVRPTLGLKVNVHCPLIESILKNKKEYKVTPNKHERLNSNYRYSTLTMLGLRNEDLQSLRAKILQWDKL